MKHGVSGKSLHPKGIIADANPYISGVYPYNHVFESESGHITEVDDSPGAERMFRQHMAGTFEEIHPDGSVVTKIVGDNYEIVIGTENIVIKGSQNITVEGSVRELIKGDYIQEIEGDFVQKIHKNHRVKVGAANDAHPRGPGGNREEEIIGNHSFNINDDIKGRVGGDSVITFEKSKIQIVRGGYDFGCYRQDNGFWETRVVMVFTYQRVLTIPCLQRPIYLSQPYRGLSLLNLVAH